MKHRWLTFPWLAFCVLFVAFWASTLCANDDLYVKRFFGFDNFLSGSSALDGGYLAALELDSDELYLGDTALIRLNHSGVVQWKRILANVLKDHIYDSMETADGGWVAVGDTYDCPMSRLCFAHPVILRLDATGAVLWQKTLDTVERGGSCCWSVIRFGDGVLLAGSMTVNRVDDVLLVALNADGNLRWAKTYGGPGAEHPSVLVPSCDGGALVFGYTETGTTNDDLFAMKVDRQGTIVWNRRYRTTEFDYVVSAAASGCSSYLGALSGGRGIVMRLNPEGNPIWRRSITVAGKDLLIRSVEAEEGLLVAGSDRTTGVIVKLDFSGQISWAKKYSGGGQGEIGSVVRNKLGGFDAAGVVYGSNRDAMVVAHLDADGRSGNCPLLTPVNAVSNPVRIQPSVLHFSTASIALTVSDLEMRYRKRGFESSVCR